MGFYKDWYEPDPFEWVDEPAEETESRRDRLKRIAKSKAESIAKRRQFAIDKQSAVQEDMIGGDGLTPDAILHDLLSWRKDFDSTSAPISRTEYDGPVAWDNGEFYKDDVPF